LVRVAIIGLKHTFAVILHPLRSPAVTTRRISLPGRRKDAIWRPSSATWWVNGSRDGHEVNQKWGQAGDIPVPGDYDGDGKTDYAIWRPSSATWWVIGSRDGHEVNQKWSENGDIPVPGDYDGDGRTDYAVWRPSTATWFVFEASMAVRFLSNGVRTEIYPLTCQSDK
jgi:FG-GAP-like repeat